MQPYFLQEWNSLPYGEGPGRIPEPLAGRLASFANASIFAGRGGEGVLEHRRHDLRARGVIGVMAVPGCTLEILPKIDVGEKEGSAQETREIRKRLVHMLAVALDLKIDEILKMRRGRTLVGEQAAQPLGVVADVDARVLA